MRLEVDMTKILKVFARQILDSRGNPTIETTIWTKNNCATASVPSGKSTGKHEAIELRDGGKKYSGLGVSKAVNNVNKIISKKLIGKELSQEETDNLMIKLDGTKEKSKLGANAILSASMAFAKLQALENNQHLYQYIGNLFENKKFILPKPFFNVINGGQHSGSNLEIQEYIVIPEKAKNFGQAMQIGIEIYQSLKQKIKEKYGKLSINVGDEGGFTPFTYCYEEPFELILETAQELGYYDKIKLAIDAAATNFYRDGRYYLEGTQLTPKELIEKYQEIINNYNITSIEDPFHEEDFENFSNLAKKTKIQIVGDDLLCTNVNRIQKAIVQGSCNCLLLKINQIGTITEALKAVKLALENNWRVMVSHRSGETNDDFISDLAVGIGCGQIKAGAPCRGERIAKYNQLLRIEEQLGKKAKYGGGL